MAEPTLTKLIDTNLLKVFGEGTIVPLNGTILTLAEVMEALAMAEVYSSAGANGIRYYNDKLQYAKYTYSVVTPSSDDNPFEEGWYELLEGQYVLSMDKKVAEGATYYSRTTTWITMYDVMIGATATTAGTAGFIIAPSAGDQDKFFKGDGTWADGLKLGETSSNAYRGDRGKTAYDDSQTNKAAIGTLANLLTTAKDNLVNALNEVHTNTQENIVSSTLLSSGWSNNEYSFESTYPSATYKHLAMDFDYDNGTDAQLAAYRSANICPSKTANKVYLKGTQPTINIPIILKVRRGQ